MKVHYRKSFPLAIFVALACLGLVDTGHEMSCGKSWDESLRHGALLVLATVGYAGMGLAVLTVAVCICVVVGFILTRL